MSTLSISELRLQLPLFRMAVQMFFFFKYIYITLLKVTEYYVIF